MSAATQSTTQGADVARQTLRERILVSDLSVPNRRAQREQWDKAIEDRLARSGTRKLIDGFFYSAYLVIGTDFLLGLVGLRYLIAAVWWAPAYFAAPLGWLWQPEVANWTVGPLAISKLDLTILPLYAMLHVVLKVALRWVTEQRSQIYLQ